MDKNAINVEQVTQAVCDALEQAERAIGYKIMFGAVGGSHSFGLQNSTSDIDCYAILDSYFSLDVIKKTINLPVQGEPLEVDAMCVTFGELLRELELYHRIPKRYPSVLYRTNAEKEQNVGRKDVVRPDFKRSILFRILLSDQVIRLDAAKNRRDEFWKGILIRDIIDYQFTRIYGNYNETISRREFVPVRKYLYTIHEICTSEALMASCEKPPMDFLRLVNLTVYDTGIKSNMINLYEKNRQAARDKAQELVPQDTGINRFIADEMSRIQEYLHTNMWNPEILQF